VKQLWLTLCCIGLLMLATPLLVQEDIDEEEPIPSSVQEILAPMDKLGQIIPWRPGLFSRVKLYEETFLNLYRYGEFNSPYLSKDCGKMMPYTFEGYTIQGNLGGKDSLPRLVYGGGYILRIKDKTSDDIIHIGYTEASYAMTFPNAPGVRFAAQFTDQRNTGSDLLTGKSFSTNQVGGKSDVSYRGGILSLAYTTNSRGYDLQNPWSGYPGYTGAMVTNYKKCFGSA